MLTEASRKARVVDSGDAEVSFEPWPELERVLDVAIAAEGDGLGPCRNMQALKWLMHRPRSRMASILNFVIKAVRS